ncbi:MAG: hypothetical protein HY034_03715 [Nitrospirae bacterium]|nr:hypothetical protein [Nitrospirota bacterium]
MKTVIILVIVGVIGFFSYAHFNRFMTSEGFKKDVEGVIQMGAPNEEMIKAAILKKAKERGVIVNPEEIVTSIEDTEEKTVAGSIVGMAGMKVETKKLTVRFPYTVKSQGFSKTYNLERFRLFTVSASMPAPNIPMGQ